MANPNPPYAHLLPTKYQPGFNGTRFGAHAGLQKIARHLRKQTKDGREVCDFLLGVMRDANERTPIRVEAAELVLNYALGKPRESLELLDERPSGVDRRALVDALSPDEQTLLQELIHRALTRAATLSIDTRPIDAAASTVIIEEPNGDIPSEPEPAGP